jgi:hypothetical protein
MSFNNVHCLLEFLEQGHRFYQNLPLLHHICEFDLSYMQGLIERITETLSIHTSAIENYCMTKTYRNGKKSILDNLQENLNGLKGN